MSYVKSFTDWRRNRPLLPLSEPYKDKEWKDSPRRGGRPSRFLSRPITLLLALVVLIVVFRSGVLNQSPSNAPIAPPPKDGTESEVITPAEVVFATSILQSALNISRDAVPEGQDWPELARRMRVFRSLYENLHNSRGYQKPAIRDIHTVGPYGKDGKIDKFSYLDGVSILEEQLYPFISHGPKHPSAADLHKTYEGRGIVMTAGNWHFNFALHAIKSLRLINCTLPIQIFYSGPKDLDADKIKQFAALEGVEPVDLSLHFDLAIANPGLPPERMGWAVKPFGMLASRFAEIILVDADALFFQNPENMFEYPHYKDTGALFFMDRTIGSGRCSALDFFEKFLADHPPSSVYRHQGRFGRLLGTHEGESGVILYDKRRNFNGLLAICKANSGKWKETMYKSVHGDKESYWMVHEVLSIPYRWAPGGGGAVGYLLDGPTPTTVRVCGGLYHPDLLHRPLWFNGGLFKNKYTNQGRKWLEVTHWASDFSFKDVKWEWESEEKPFCLIRERNKQGEDWGALTDPEKGSIKAFIDQWEQLKLSA